MKQEFFEFIESPEAEKQSLQRAEQKHLDVILTKQGREVVFDITDAYETLTVGPDEQDD